MVYSMNATPVPMTGTNKAKKEPPKLIEKVVDSLEEFLTKPAKQSKSQSKSDDPVDAVNAQIVKEQLKSKPPNPEEAQAQGSLGGKSEYTLPKGTLIRLPDGKEFETHTESKITKI